MVRYLPTVLVLGPDARPARINMDEFDPGLHLTWEQARREAEVLAARPMSQLKSMARELGLQFPGPGKDLNKQTLSLRLLSARRSAS